MPGKSTMAKAGFKTAKRTPAKGKLARCGLKLGKRKAVRTPAGTAALYVKALVSDEQARTELREGIASARSAYRRSSDRHGRPHIRPLLEDRKARREAQDAVTSLKNALQIAGKKRKQPKSAKGPMIAVIAVAGAGTALAVNKGLRAKVLAPFKSND